MNWKFKAFVQRFASIIPFGNDMYFWGQKMLGGFKEFKIDSRLQFAMELIDCLVDQCESLEGKRAVEIGTGWAPVLPMFFWLYGLTECHTYDIHWLLRPSFVQQTAAQIDFYCSQNRGLITQWKNRDIVLENKRLPLLEKLIMNNAASETILTNCGITYHAPADVSQTVLPDNSIDIVFSNLVLGEIPIKGLDAIFSEVYRILHPGGFMLHCIDLGDQFASGQKDISKINFLQYSEREFSKYNSSINYQNRLRAPVYRQLFEKHGFTVTYWRGCVDQKALEQINNIQLHTDFSSYSPDDLCTSTVYVMTRKSVR